MLHTTHTFRGKDGVRSVKSLVVTSGVVRVQGESGREVYQGLREYTDQIKKLLVVIPCAAKSLFKPSVPAFRHPGSPRMKCGALLASVPA
eukprot:9389251-Pyramimonas_sp.AAC.1